MARGVLVTWFGGREFGFMQPEDGGPDVLVHARDFVSQPHEGQSYEFSYCLIAIADQDIAPRKSSECVMRGKVIFWKRDFANPKTTLFGWGFIAPDGCGEGKSTRVYFNERRARYSPVRRGDVVEYELAEPDPMHEGHAAFKVGKIE